MDEEGIDVAVIFGTPIALTVNGLQDKGLAGAMCHAVNRWLVEEYCAADPQRLKGVGLIPCQDPAAAARELEFLAQQHGIVSAMLPTNVYGINLGDRRFDPIYAAAQADRHAALGAPQTGHDGQYGVSGVMGAGSERMEKYSYVHMTAFPFELMIALMHMIGEGVFDRFPRLKVGFMEGGSGWIPFWSERLDEHLEKLRPQWPDCSASHPRSSTASRSRFTCEPEEETLPYVLEHDRREPGHVRLGLRALGLRVPGVGQQDRTTSSDRMRRSAGSCWGRTHPLVQHARRRPTECVGVLRTRSRAARAA